MSRPGVGSAVIRPRPLGHRAIGLTAVALILTLSLAPAPAAQAATPAEYQEIVGRALDAVANAVDTDDGERALAGREAGALLAGVGSIDLGNGQMITPVEPALRAALNAGDLATARSQLTALLHALDVAASVPGPPPDAAAQLAAILARPEFRPPEPNVAERLLAPVLEPLRLAWERFWRGLRARLSAPAAGGPDVVLLVLGALVVAGLGALIAGAFAGNVVGGARTVAARGSARRGRLASRARAFELAAAGDYRAAMREMNLATLLALDERRLLRFQPDRTNREHAAAGRVDAAIRAALAPLVDVYDRLWYSGAPVSADDWRRFAALADDCVTPPSSGRAAEWPTEPSSEAGTR